MNLCIIFSSKNSKLTEHKYLMYYIFKMYKLCDYIYVIIACKIKTYYYFVFNGFSKFLGQKMVIIHRFDNLSDLELLNSEFLQARIRVRL